MKILPSARKHYAIQSITDELVRVTGDHPRDENDEEIPEPVA
jgi:hypothetical protein